MQRVLQARNIVRSQHRVRDFFKRVSRLGLIGE